MTPHYFCPVCGSAPLEDAIYLKNWGVNIRCVEGADLGKVTYKDANLWLLQRLLSATVVEERLLYNSMN